MYLSYFIHTHTHTGKIQIYNSQIVFPNIHKINNDIKKKQRPKIFYSPPHTEENESEYDDEYGRYRCPNSNSQHLPVHLTAIAIEGTSASVVIWGVWGEERGVMLINNA